MNQEELKKTIAEYFAKLPKESQEVFSSMVWMDTLKDIIKKYSLNPKEEEVLGVETTLVLLGIIHIEEYKDNLKRDLNIEEETLEKILLEINERILKNIEKQLLEVFKSNIEYLESQEESNNESLNKPAINQNPTFESISDKIPLPPYSRIKTDRPEPIQPLILKREEPLKVPEVTKNILEDKLNNITVSKNTVSDHSTVSKIANTPTPSKGGDPYREEI